MKDTIAGKEKIAIAQSEMIGIQNLLRQYSHTKPLDDIAILVCVTPTPQTGVLLLALQSLGAKIAACSDNAYAADDDVVAYVKSQGIAIFAKSNMTHDEYHEAMENAVQSIDSDLQLQIIDDGCDITQYLAENHPQVLKRARVVSEQTTCGVNFLKTLHKANQLPIPAININNSYTKKWFDNYLGIRQSLIHGLASVGLSVSGKKISIFGYGPVGKGAAVALRAHGAHVSIVEKDITLLMQAELEGFTPISVKEALSESQICISATGCIDTISADDIQSYAHDGLILGNIGHGNREFDISYLKKKAKMRRIGTHLDGYRLQDGREIIAMCDGALVNFLAGGGNSSVFMSLTFTLTLLAHIYVAEGRIGSLAPGVYDIFSGLEKTSVELNYPHLMKKISVLTPEQESYLHEGQVDI